MSGSKDWTDSEIVWKDGRNQQPIAQIYKATYIRLNCPLYTIYTI